MIPHLPTQVVIEMARRRRRFQHYLWHRVRNSWPRLTPAERQAVRDINPAWEPPRPACDAAGSPERDNGSGEDFLYMHRRMLALVNDLLARLKDPLCPRVEGWPDVPPPGDRVYPVPEFPDSELEEVKSDAYFGRFISPWARRYTDAEYLRSVTLGQLGSDIEFTIHRDLHVRWAARSPVGYRPPAVGERGIGAEWDAPAYDYLGDTYSSHVNPVFWKIHGWVDERVEDWKRAHAVRGEIRWRGTWVGPSAEDEGGLRGTAGVAGGASGGALEDAARIDRIISASAARGFDGFFRPTFARRSSPPRTRP